MDNAEVMTVLPKELRLGAPPTMPQARSYLFRQQSSLSTYNPDDQIQINIPRLQRSYLRKDSYLQFRLNGQYQADLKTTAVTRTPGDEVPTVVSQFCPDLLLDDAGAWGLFERIEVFDYLGSTVLESIDGLPQLMSLLLDMGPTFTDPDHQGQAAQGLMSPYVANSVRDNSVVYISESTADITIDSSFFTASNNILYVTTGGKTVAFTISATAIAPGNNATANAAVLINAATDSTGLTLVEYGINALCTTKNRIRLSSYNVPFTVATGTSSAHTKLNLPLTAATPSQRTVTQQIGLGIPFYQGGLPLISSGITAVNGKYDFSYQFSIPLPSFLGILSKKMVPLHNGFTIVLTLASKYKPIFTAFKQNPSIIYQDADPQATGFPGQDDNLLKPVAVLSNNTIEPQVGQSNVNGPNTTGGANNWNDPLLCWWQVTDVAMVCQILELGPVAESMILSGSQGQPLIVHTKQFRNYRGSSAKNQAEFSLPLNLNVASLTNILWFMRPDGTENDLRYQSCGARHRNFLNRWEFQYGSTTLPQSQGIQAMFMTSPTASSGNTWVGNEVGIATGFTECFSEFMKSRPIDSSKSRLSVFQYATTAYPGLGNLAGFAQTPFKTVNFSASESATLGKFACGLNTELAPGKSGDLISGLNTNGMNTSIRGYFHPSYLTNNDKFNVTIDAFAEYDAFINISPGIATTVSF